MTSVPGRGDNISPSGINQISLSAVKTQNMA